MLTISIEGVELIPNCRDCFHCKIKKGIIYCKQDMWLNYHGNTKTLKSLLINVFEDSRSPQFLKKQAQGCIYFDSMNEEEIG